MGLAHLEEEEETPELTLSSHLHAHNGNAVGGEQPPARASLSTEGALSLFSVVPACKATRNHCCSPAQPVVLCVAAHTREEVLTRQQLNLPIWSSLDPAVPLHGVRFGYAAHRFPFLLKLVRVKFLINISTIHSCWAGAPDLSLPAGALCCGGHWGSLLWTTVTHCILPMLPSMSES